MPLSFQQIDYQQVKVCPQCGDTGRYIGILSRGTYRFGRQEIYYPHNEQIELLRCRRCNLVFKNWVPTPAAIANLFWVAKGQVWPDHRFSYGDEVAIIRRAVGRDPESVLDIGAGAGDFLRALQPLTRRRSALDVTKNPACAQWVNDEYIESFIETLGAWTGKTYELVAALDLLEHIYQPRAAAGALSRFLAPNGVFIAQTGDSDLQPDLGRWWYMNLLEHHICWNRQSLEFFADICRFKVENVFQVQHKGRRYMHSIKKLIVLSLHLMRWNGLFRKFSIVITGLDPVLVGNPYRKDHITIVFRKVANGS
jgi:SAM-dependent methyltransferase